jgi:uncharacterized membrane protein YfcA
MTLLALTLWIALGAFTAGLLGALTGLGGGVVIVPMLTLLFHVSIRYAIGASLVSVIATSSGAAAAYVREGYTNIRVGMFLEMATTAGAIAGGVLAAHLSAAVVSVVFGVVLIVSALLTLRAHGDVPDTLPPDPLAQRLHLDSAFPTPDGPRAYRVHHLWGGFSLMLVAGTLSSLLGIGSGAVKVLAMDRIMRLPFKVSTTTSNFMIGVTAAAGAGVYLNRGYIDPALAMPVMLGVLAGSMLGARMLVRARTVVLQRLFGIVILVLAVEMIHTGLSGGHG